MNKARLFEKISNFRIDEDVLLKEKVTWDYNVPYKCIVAGIENKEESVAFEIGICIDEDIFCVELFTFRTIGVGKRFLDSFLETAFPNEEELKVSNIIGKTFIGEVVDNNGYMNIHAISACDEPIEDDGFREADVDERVFV